MSEITLVVVDDHPLFRQGMRDVLSLEPDFHVLGDASDGEEALAIVRQYAPMIAVLDINLPGLNGISITRQIKVDKLPTRVVLVTAYDDLEQVIHAMRAGASAYCAKNIHPDELAKVIRHAAAGKYVIHEQVMDKADLERWLKNQGDLNAEYDGSIDMVTHPLSAREMEVLACITRGMSNKEIASLLGISNQTIKNHVTSILRKLGVEDRTQAAVYALKKGWVRLSG
jgi:DNA-binding NarL/FixJ family response regulator